MNPLALTLFSVGLVLAVVTISIDMAGMGQIPSDSTFRRVLNGCAAAACVLLVLGTIGMLAR